MRFRIVTVAILLVLAAAVAAPAQQYKIGVFDSARVLTESRTGQAAQEELNQFKNERQAEITTREKALEEFSNEFLNKSLTLSDERKESMQAELEKRRIEFGRFYKDSERELMQQIEKAQKELMQKLSRVIEEYGNANGFSLIFERGQCAFNSDAVDITDDIVRQFDSRHAPGR
jgi:outer membrane protein